MVVVPLTTLSELDPMLLWKNASPEYAAWMLAVPAVNVPAGTVRMAKYVTTGVPPLFWMTWLTVAYPSVVLLEVLVNVTRPVGFWPAGAEMIAVIVSGLFVLALAGLKIKEVDVEVRLTVRLVMPELAA